MNLKNRLKKLEPISPKTPEVIVVRYPAELVELCCAGETFERNQGEPEDEFIKRIKQLVLQKPEKRNPIILVGNF